MTGRDAGRRVAPGLRFYFPAVDTCKRNGLLEYGGGWTVARWYAIVFVKCGFVRLEPKRMAGNESGRRSEFKHAAKFSCRGRLGLAWLTQRCLPFRTSVPSLGLPSLLPAHRGASEYMRETSWSVQEGHRIHVTKSAARTVEVCLSLLCLSPLSTAPRSRRRSVQHCRKAF